MLTAYPARLVIDGEIYRLAEPKKSRLPKPSGVAPRTKGTKAKSKPTTPATRPSHRRPRPKTAPPPRPQTPGGQFDLSRLRVPRHPEVERAWQAFQERGKFRPRGARKDVSWETLRKQDPQTAFELKRKFVEAWRKKLQQQGVETPPTGSGAPESAPAEAKPGPTETTETTETPEAGPEKPEEELSDEDLEEVEDEPKPEKPEEELSDEDLEEVEDEPKPEAPTLETRHKPVSTRAPAGEETPPAEEAKPAPKAEEPAKKPEAKVVKEVEDLLNKPVDAAKDNQEVAEHQRVIRDTMKELGIPGELTDDVIVGPSITTLTVKVPRGERFEGSNLVESLEADSGVEGVKVTKQVGSTVKIKVPNKKRTFPVLRQVTDSKEFKEAPPSTVAIGMTQEGEPITVDLGDSNSAHILLTGGSGSGKSVALRSLVTSVLLRDPKDQKLVVLDPKSEFNQLAGIPHLAMPIVDNEHGDIVEKADKAMKKLVDEMEDRYRKLKPYNGKLDKYNADHPNDKIPRIAILCDEFNDLLGEAGKSQFEHNLARVFQKGRACGMNIILANQGGITSDMLKEKSIKNNLSVKIALKAGDRQGSINTLGEKGAEDLQGKGDGLIKRGGQLVNFQAPLLSDEEWESTANKLKKRKPDYFLEHKEYEPLSDEDKPGYREDADEGAAPPEAEPPEDAEDLQEVEPNEHDVANAEKLKESVPEAEVSEEEDRHSKHFRPLGEMKRYNDGQLAALHKDAWQRLQRETAKTKKELKQDKAALKKETDPAKQAVIQKKIDANQQTQTEFEAAAKYHLDKISTAMGARQLKVPTEYKEPTEEDEDPFGLKPDWGDYEHEDGGEGLEHTAPPVQVVTRPESRQERKDRRQQEKAQRAEETARARGEQPAPSAAPAKAPAPEPAKAPEKGGLPSPAAPPADHQAAHEHLREQGVSDEVAKHVSELLSEPHDPQQLQRAMSQTVEKAVTRLNDPNSRADVLAAKGGVAHMLVKKFGAGKDKAGQVLKRMRKAAGGAWGAFWSGLKKLFGAIGKGLAGFFKKLVHHAKRFGSVVTGIEARRQARLNQATRHLHSRVPLHTAPVAAMVYYRGVPYVA